MKSFIPAIFWALIILALSVSPGVNLPETSWDLIGPDKLAHALAYFILGGALLWGFHRRKPLRLPAIIAAVSISAGYGVLMEILQWRFFPYRYFELYDILSNIIGSLVSVLLTFFINKPCQYE